MYAPNFLPSSKKRISRMSEKCKECGKANNSGYKVPSGRAFSCVSIAHSFFFCYVCVQFCKGCGAPPTPSGDTVKCSECGKSNNAGYKFCKGFFSLFVFSFFV